jgi:integrase
MLTIDSVEFSALTLAEAVPIWKQIREQRERLRPRTHEATRTSFVALEKFFGDVRLKDITAGQLREYQIARTKNLLSTEHGDIHPWRAAAGHSTINHEMSALGKLLHHCGLWARLKLYYAPLAIPAWSPRDVLSEDDEAHLFDVVRDHPEAELAYWVACITNNTSAAGCELRGLQLKHLTFRQPTIDKKTRADQTPSEVYIPPEIVKNRNRPRRIPLNAEALWAFQQCYKRALACGSCQPEHYLFPFRVRIGEWDPERGATRSWLRKSWGHLVRISKLKGLHPHDLRHQCITRMLEAGVAGETVRAVAGHVNPKVMEYYSHVRLQAKLAAVMSLVPAKKKSPERETMSA